MLTEITFTVKSLSDLHYTDYVILRRNDVKMMEKIFCAFADRHLTIINQLCYNGRKYR